MPNEVGTLSLSVQAAPSLSVLISGTEGSSGHDVSIRYAKGDDRRPQGPVPTSAAPSAPSRALAQEYDQGP
jgi:hypothetical protein